jgi:alpha-ketoglutarate-dependent taurine dioxygenase
MYLLQLSDSDRDNLQRVARAAEGWGLDGDTLAALRRRLAECDALRAIGTQLRDGLRSNGAVVVSNMPLSDAELVSLMQMVAVPSPAGNGDVLLYDVVPTEAELTDLSRTASQLPLHTDSTFLRAPHDVLGLVCVDNPPGAGGESLVLRAAVAVDMLRAAGGDGAVDALMDPVFPFYLRDPLTGHGVQLVPVLELDDDDVHVRFRGDIVDALATRHGLDDRHAQALEVLQRVLAESTESGVADRVGLTPGDMLLVDNRRALHGRTAISDARARRLRRMKGFALQTAAYRIV